MKNKYRVWCDRKNIQVDANSEKEAVRIGVRRLKLPRTYWNKAYAILISEEHLEKILNNETGAVHLGYLDEDWTLCDWLILGADTKVIQTGKVTCPVCLREYEKIEKRYINE